MGISHSTTNSTIELSSVNELTELIKEGKFQMDKEPWGSISNAAKNLIRNLIVLDPDMRIEPDVALAHKWFKNSKEAKQQQAVLFFYFRITS